MTTDPHAPQPTPGPDAPQDAGTVEHKDRTRARVEQRRDQPTTVDKNRG